MGSNLGWPAGATLALGNAALVLTAGAATWSLTGFSYAIKGKAYTKATVSAGNGPALTTDCMTGAAFKPLAAGQATVFAFYIDAAGTVTAAQGTIVTLDASGGFMDVPQFPSCPSDRCMFAYAVVKTAGAATFTMGTTNWNAANVTSTPVSIITETDRPQIS